VRAIDRLREKRLATLFSGAEARVAKYKHTLNDALLLTPAEVALLCVLMLRGPQTVGELRTRTERLFVFDNLPDVEAALNVLAARQPQPLVARLPRAPGTKESRYTHLLAGPLETMPAAAAPPPPATPEPTALEAEVAALRRELAELKQQFAEFRKQFE